MALPEVEEVVVELVVRVVLEAGVDEVDVGAVPLVVLEAVPDLYRLSLPPAPQI